jgi:serine/threonine protein kinase
MLKSELLTAGSILANRYQIVRELGRGGFGRTYLACDLNKFQEQCVLKEFAPQVEGAEQLVKARELFEREAGVLYKLKHPQIPTFREMFAVRSAAGESLFLVEEYIEGMTYLDLLNQRLQTGQTFSEAEILQFLRDFLPVLAYIHERSVIHRDLSPDNIMYRSGDRLPVPIDFGGVKEIAVTAAANYGGNNIAATRIGKPGFSPDEQILRGKVSPASDLYTLAATTLTLLTGKQPQDLYNSSNGKWEWQGYTRLSPDLSNIIDRMLAYRPIDRYQSAMAVLADLPQSTANVAANSTPPPRPAAPPLLNHLSKLKTFALGNAKPVAPAATVVSPVKSHDWKKPAWRVTKITGKIFFLVVVGHTAFKWIASFDFGKAIDRQVSEITRSIPNPFANQPSVEERQTDLDRQLKAANISRAEFYRQVDKTFYAKHPELKNRPLTKKAADLQLRQEWQDLARELLAKKKAR